MENNYTLKRNMSKNQKNTKIEWETNSNKTKKVDDRSILNTYTSL